MSQQQFPLDNEREGLPDGAVEVSPGAIWVPGWLDLDSQVDLLEACRQWAKPPAGIRQPRMPDGAPFSTRAVCLGWHWYPYRYSRTCDDGDGSPVKPSPSMLGTLGRDACTATGYAPARYDAAIINLYTDGAKLGLHQDKIEGDAVIAAGSPVVTISLGDTCTFRFGNIHRPTRPFVDIQLASGDLFVFGGAQRLAFHGVPKVHYGKPGAQRTCQRHIARVGNGLTPTPPFKSIGDVALVLLVAVFDE